MKMVGLFYCDCHQPEVERLAEICVSSVRKNIPQAKVVQFSDLRTREFPFVDEVSWLDPKGFGLMEFRIHHFASYPHEEALFLDPDTVVQGDPWAVFCEPFDVALTYRTAPLLTRETRQDITDAMPYNTGVMFSRGNGFWKRVCELLKVMPLDDRNWFGEQMVIGALAKTGEFRVHEIPDSTYNYTPKKREEDVSEKLIVHYKGSRKAWMHESSRNGK